jgi:hypothetical protein
MPCAGVPSTLIERFEERKMPVAPLNRGLPGKPHLANVLAICGEALASIPHSMQDRARHILRAAWRAGINRRLPREDILQAVHQGCHVALQVSIGGARNQKIPDSKARQAVPCAATVQHRAREMATHTGKIYSAAQTNTTLLKRLLSLSTRETWLRNRPTQTGNGGTGGCCAYTYMKAPLREVGEKDEAVGVHVRAGLHLPTAST